MPKLGIVVSHPIQYYAPLFRFLANHIDLQVLYGLKPTAEQVGQSGFGQAVDWGLDLLEGYPHQFLENRSKAPSTDAFSGIDTPEIGRALISAGVTHVLILGWQIKSYWQAFLYCLTHSVPVSVRGDSQIQNAEPIPKSTARRLLYPLFLRRYKNIFYVGARNKAYLLRNGALPNQLLFAPHAVDQDFWRSQLQPRAPTSRIRFLWVAKFIPKKRPFDVITGFKEALRAAPDMELWMVGTGELMPECEALASDEARIRLLGFKNQVELRNIYADADCLILTSDYGETWGLVVNEAMSMGLPAIVSDACGCSDDLIEQGKTGFTYPLGDTHVLGECIVRTAALLRDNPEQFRMALAAANQKYSFSTNLSAIREFMEQPA